MEGILLTQVMNFYPFSFPKKNTKLTSRSVRNMLPEFLNQVNKNCSLRPDLVPLAWPEILGDQLAPMTRAEVFKDGILYVIVFNSTLLSILSHRERHILLKKLKARFPKTDIKEIRFRLG